MNYNFTRPKSIFNTVQKDIDSKALKKKKNTEDTEF